MSNLSEQQKSVLRAVLDQSIEYIKICAISGSGKTHTLQAIASLMKPTRGLYLAYNKAIADESQEKFDKNTIRCSTIHSMAYSKTVAVYGFNVGGDITGRIFSQYKISFNKSLSQNEAQELFEYYSKFLRYLDYTRKDLMANLIKKFFLSKYVKFTDYVNEALPGILEPDEVKVCMFYIDMIKNKIIPCTHGFYLKLFHILLANNKIAIPKYDLLMLDEAGDVNPVSLEIFKLLKSTKKIMVGDNQQNIYSFNDTINGFKELEGIGVMFDLTTSFRVTQAIAECVESFSKKYLDKDMNFNGRTYTIKDIPNEYNRTVAYISRTNSLLVEKMIEYEDSHTPYNLTKTVESVFRLYRTLIFIKAGAVQRDPDLQYIQHDCDEYDSNFQLQRDFKNVYAYLIHKNKDNVQLKSAMQVLAKYGKDKILSIYKLAKEHEQRSNSHKITLTTAHSSKGLEFDVVHIMDDLNDVLDKIIKEYKVEEAMLYDKNIHPSMILPNNKLEEFRLYYVAGTRAKHKLYNAKYFSDEYLLCEDFL